MNIITWNMQGATGFGQSKWTADVTRLITSGAEIICLQEAGERPPSGQNIQEPDWILGGHLPPPHDRAFVEWNLGTRSRPIPVYIYWVRSDTGANRNNLAIVTTRKPKSLIYVDGGANGARPAIGIELMINNTPVSIYSLHAFSPGGANAPAILQNIHAVGIQWFALGDFNRSPDTWAGLPAWIVGCPHTGGVTHPGSGAILDYAFKSPGPPVYGEVLSHFVASDHYPVLYRA